MILHHQYVIAVPDLERSCAFYRDVLGFEISELAPGWLLYAKGACRVMAGECPDALPPRELGDHSYFGYLVVDDVDTYHERVIATGAEVVKSLRDEPWGMREFGVRTADGHRLMIGSEVGRPGPAQAGPRIVRIWHGRVPTARAGAYREFLNRRALPDYRSVPGNLGACVLERSEGEVTHFVTLTEWQDRDSIRRFAGEDIERAKYYPEDVDFLLEFEPTVTHYEVVGSLRP